MISCVTPAGALGPAPRPPGTGLTPAVHGWGDLLHHGVKREPIDGDQSTFAKDSTNGFLSEGFHSASPSSSSKDSNQHSPRSIDSSRETSPAFYDIAMHGKHALNMDSYQSNLPYNILTPPGYDVNVRPQDHNSSPSRYGGAYSPNGTRKHGSTPINNSNGTPPHSPITASLENHSQYDSYEPSVNNNQTRPNVKPEGSKFDDCESRDGSLNDDIDFDDEPGLRVPAVNSHGKVKTFKCKQCEFVAVTKLDFWEHTKEHIKPEKMLTCPKCPFVTEYKHHLEYHMRNHFGSKPFQCPQCSYSCVNKSMLNSHLKSHSNIYQYRCADCNYATKYCHSLKLHLRKYQHNPAMVLNQDGTPNPLPIIDVYGTRRGPKQKSKHQDELSNSTPANNQHSHPLFQNPFGVSFPYPPLIPHPFLFSQNAKYADAQIPTTVPDIEKSPIKDASHYMDPTLPSQILQQRLIYGDSLHLVSNNYNLHGKTTPDNTNYLTPTKQASPGSPQRRESPLHLPNGTTDALDLTSTACNNKSSGESKTPPPINNSTPLTPTASIKNRRKGRAFKLQPAALRLQHATSTEDDEVADSTKRLSPINRLDKCGSLDEDMNEDQDMDVVKSSDSEDSNGPTVTSKKGDFKKCQDSGYESESKKSKPTYDCQYCDITFRDIVMYTMHMGYHGYNEPFTCNMCGERSTDKVAFFIHIARTQHS